MSSIAAMNHLSQMQADTVRVQGEQSLANRGTGKIDKHAFMNLLLAQLKNQDPTNPMSNQEFVSQQAQFAQIEKLDELNATMKQGNLIAQGSSMIGKIATFEREGQLITGVIDSVNVSADSIGLNVGDMSFTMDQVKAILSQMPTAP